MFFRWPSLRPALHITIPMANFIITSITNEQFIIFIIKPTSITHISKLSYIISLTWFPFLLLLHNIAPLQNFIIFFIIFQLPSIIISRWNSWNPNCKNFWKLLFAQRTEWCPFWPNVQTFRTKSMSTWVWPCYDCTRFRWVLLESRFNFFNTDCTFKKNL